MRTNRSGRTQHANKSGRGIAVGKNSHWMDDDAVPSDHVDPDFDDFEGAEQDIREHYGHLADDN